MVGSNPTGISNPIDSGTNPLDSINHLLPNIISPVEVPARKCEIGLSASSNLTLLQVVGHKEKFLEVIIASATNHIELGLAI